LINKARLVSYSLVTLRVTGIILPNKRVCFEVYFQKLDNFCAKFRKPQKTVVPNDIFMSLISVVSQCFASLFYTAGGSPADCQTLNAVSVLVFQHVQMTVSHVS